MGGLVQPDEAEGGVRAPPELGVVAAAAPCLGGAADAEEDVR